MTLPGNSQKPWYQDDEDSNDKKNDKKRKAGTAGLRGLNADLAIEVIDFLRAHSKMEDGYVIYTDDWTEEKVAARFNLATSAVSRVRLRHIGRIKSIAAGRPRSANKVLLERVNALEEVFVKISDDVKSILDRLTRAGGI